MRSANAEAKSKRNRDTAALLLLFLLSCIVGHGMRQLCLTCSANIDAIQRGVVGEKIKNGTPCGNENIIKQVRNVARKCALDEKISIRKHANDLSLLINMNIYLLTHRSNYIPLT